MPQEYSTISPYMLYEDAAAALDFLANAFGLRERMRMTNDDGSVGHAEMELGDSVIMLGQPGEGYESPSRHGNVTVMIHVYVDDVDAHFERAKQAGADIQSEPTDQEYGDRRYDAKDPEGHHWFFAQPIRQPATAESGAATA